MWEPNVLYCTWLAGFVEKACSLATPCASNRSLWEFSTRTGSEVARCSLQDKISKESSVTETATTSGSDEGSSADFDKVDSEEEDATYIPPVRVVSENDMDMHPFILSHDEMQQMAIHVLPRGITYCSWQRLYSLARDGDSFDACIKQLRGHAKTLMVIRTSRSAVFGGFADQAWEPHTKGGTRYFGGATTSLFSIQSASAATADTSTATIAGNEAIKTTLRTYKWTGANRYFQLCDLSRKMLAFGGGGKDGAFGLCVEEDFQVGSTGPCATFGNEPLCEQENFNIVDMEVFCFLVGQF